MEEIEWFVPQEREALVLNWVLTTDGLRMRWTRVPADTPAALLPPTNVESDRLKHDQAA